MKTPIDVPIHLQDDPDNCGQACAQMVVAALTSRLLAQTTLDNDSGPGLLGWGTTPDELCSMINAQLRDDHPSYEVHRGTYQAMMNYAATATEGMPRSPVVALVASGDHWAVVQGF